MSREQLVYRTAQEQGQMPQVPPDLTKLILKTVEKYLQDVILENIERKLRILVEQVTDTRDKIRALERTVTGDFVDSLVKSLTEDRVRRAILSVFADLERGLSEKVQNMTSAVESLRADYGEMAGKLEELVVRVDRVERTLAETPPPQRVQIDTKQAEEKVRELGRQIEELEKKVSEVAVSVSELEGTVRRALEGIATLVEELERSVSGREEGEEL